MIKYKNISSGYLGVEYNNSTLNSQYYRLLFEEIKFKPELLDEIIIFPQRIPRAGFFKEICLLEGSNYKKHFDEMIVNIITSHKNALHSLIEKNQENDVRRYINWSNILLRYGCFEQVINHFPINYIGSHALEVELIKETAKIELLLSQDKPIGIDEQLELSERFLDRDDVSDRAKIILLNQIVVHYYRHQRKSKNDLKIFKLSKLLLELTTKFEDNKFMNTFLCSVSYRGLAMDSGFGNELQESFLNKAEQLARNIQYKTDMEKIVASDNLFTCLQSISKWHIHNNKMNSAEKYLKEMIEIDPYDSTGYSEIGFLYINLEKYDVASHHFKEAMELGPPGAGMNAYYYAKCLEKLGRDQEAITYLYEATKLDEEGLSPWLDLMNYFIDKKNQDKASEIANQIYNSPILFEQLEDDETKIIQALIQ